MAHFAKLDENNVVIDVHVVNNDDVLNLPFPASEPVGIQYLINWCGGLHTNWKQTSYNNNFRFRYASIGDKYDETRDAFVRPSPYPSWVLDEETLTYQPPIPYPESALDENGFYTKMYLWDEDTVSWKEVTF